MSSEFASFLKTSSSYFPLRLALIKYFSPSVIVSNCFKSVNENELFLLGLYLDNLSHTELDIFHISLDAQFDH